MEVISDVCGSTESVKRKKKNTRFIKSGHTLFTGSLESSVKSVSITVNPTLQLL
jgi:hypothetical protein